MVDYDSYVKSLLSCLKSALEIAQRHSSAEQHHQAQQYNKRAKGTCLSLGDRFLVANKGECGRRKLADKWEDGVCTVVGANSGIYVYKIEDAAGHKLVVHRNLLLKVNFLPISGLDQIEDACVSEMSFTSEESGQADDAQDPSVSRKGKGFDSFAADLPESESADLGEQGRSGPEFGSVCGIVDNTSLSCTPHSDSSHSQDAISLGYNIYLAVQVTVMALTRLLQCDNHRCKHSGNFSALEVKEYYCATDSFYQKSPVYLSRSFQYLGFEILQKRKFFANRQ